MRTAPLLLLLLAHLSDATVLTTAQACTAAQIQSFEGWRMQQLPLKCSVQDAFRACDDDCQVALETIAANATNCTRTSQTLYAEAKEELDECDFLRPLMRNKYMPLVGVGLPNCTREQIDEWREKLARTPFGACAANATTKIRNCSDACLQVLEAGISNAPRCANTSGYSLGESSKLGLVNCLRVRGENIVDNKVLFAVVNGDGSININNETTSKRMNAAARTKSPAPASSAPCGSTASLVSAIVVVDVVLLLRAMA